MVEKKININGNGKNQWQLLDKKKLKLPVQSFDHNVFVVQHVF
jgi:hypothetical protein